MPASNSAKTASELKSLLRAGRILWRPQVYLSLLALVVLVLPAAKSVSRSADDCREEYRHDTRIVTSNRTLRAETALSSKAQELGLSGRRCMPDGTAMLFAFPSSGLQCFWMKGMRFSIDIIWLDDQKKILHVAENISPSTYPSQIFCPPVNAKYVIEVPGGSALASGFQNGSLVNF